MIIRNLTFALLASATPAAAQWAVTHPCAENASALPAAATASATPDAAEVIRIALRGVHFIPNEGQWSDESVAYGLKTQGLEVAFRHSSLTMYLSRPMNPSPDGARGRAAVVDFRPEPHSVTPASAHGCPDEPVRQETLAITVSFPGANLVTPRGIRPGTTRFNYFVGDESDWASHVPSYEAVVYESIYDGIDLHVMGSDGVLKYEFHCAAGADHTQIRVRYDGIEGLSLNPSGDLHITSAFGTLLDNAPIAWQDGAGHARRDIPAHFELLDPGAYTIALGATPDQLLPLVIDPEIEWMYYLGGTDYDVGRDVAIDSAGNALVTGVTHSTDFAGANNSYHGGIDAFALKVSPSGDLQWMTYLGGSNRDESYDIASDSAGNALVTGITSSRDFAGRNNSYHGGDYDAFALKVSPEGQLEWMTYLGGSSHDGGNGGGITVDRADNVLVSGGTHSTNFEGRINSYHGGFYDVFCLKISPSGQLQWMTYLGGSGGETGYDIVVDSAGDALITGDTTSRDFEGRNNSYRGGEADAFALKVSPSGKIQWMTYLGGSDIGLDNWDSGRGIAVDSAGNALVTGLTPSTDFAGAINSYHGGPYDAFALVVSPSGELKWMTYLGGGGFDAGHGIAVDGAGRMFVVGGTRSIDFVGAADPSHGGSDAFLLEVSPSGEVQWMNYLGGSDGESAVGIGVDSAGNALVAGNTSSADFAGRKNPYYGDVDAFVIKIQLDACYADCDGSGSLDFFDFLCFQNLFAAGDPLADCDESGKLDFFDFLCFQNAFATGCP